MEPVPPLKLPQLFTIGYDHWDFADFVDCLRDHGVTALADVRSHPYSRRFPQFCQGSLQETLPLAGLAYGFLGQQLGARSPDPACYDGGKAQYSRIAATDPFAQGLARLQQGLQRHTIVLMCAEQDPITCHRAILICRSLRHWPIAIHHILKDGSLESQSALETRLLHLHAPPAAAQLSLFDPPQPSGSREECLERAYACQGDRIAYRVST
ncbi:DUF488 domain-containing protein [Prochlorothrix hollandica]|uniref:DUF488 domain-containing protein n=1 Tax=Prochlorothrix hollandica PCC 9006 = CALU 1027 TaxID=317619 RepID=A0A0M2Q417_PROHO|nr:DUF488 domain-containing protein [Prochlorothrix hollandica]KKJ01674.1 hypothetical protein PROH_02915 [Prochlorothrix hollandica PCC 9006 = CALU 1027]